MCKVLCKIISKGRACVSLFEKISKVRVRIGFQKYSFHKDLKDKGKNNFQK